MGAQRYAFKVGNIDCMVLLDEARVIGPEGVLMRFPDADEFTYRRAFTDIGLTLDEADDNFNMLLLQIGTETVLVDAGQGQGGYLLESLELAGVVPEAVTLVVITHTHGDHVQGLLLADGEPAFPNATYVIAREELPFWEGRILEGAVDHRPIIDMLQARGLRLIDTDEVIIPGLTAVSLVGHTPGHIGLLLESEAERLLHMADLLHSPMQFAHPEWSAVFDVDTGASVPMRRAMLRQAAEEHVLTLFYHLTFPGLGWIGQTGEGFNWEPLEIEG